ncbi:MAG: DUF937 domain-containing protein [Saprospiraceae bacterium]|nr:DUF937 domain-containing protein [Saprospiraceae bacterium]
MNITDLLQGQMKDVLVSQLTKQLGVNNPEQAQTAVDGTVITIMNALARNVAKPEGAGALLSALNRDHDGSILNDLGGFLSGQVKPTNESTINGAGILKHILGGQQNNAVETISKQSGLDVGKVTQLMITLAPIIMGFLGKEKSQTGDSPGGLMDLVLNSTKTVNKQQPNSSIFTKMLDKDGDGSVMDDLAGMGMKALFNKLLGRK